MCGGGERSERLLALWEDFALRKYFAIRNESKR